MASRSGDAAAAATRSQSPPLQQNARHGIMQGAPAVRPKGYDMKKTFAIAVAAGLISLSACNSSPREQAADNIEANTEAVADNLEDAADNVSSDAAEQSLENKADAVRATGQNQADDMRTNDPDTNLSNGI